MPLEIGITFFPVNHAKPYIGFIKMSPSCRVVELVNVICSEYKWDRSEITLYLVNFDTSNIDDNAINDIPTATLLQNAKKMNRSNRLKDYNITEDAICINVVATRKPDTHPRNTFINALSQRVHPHTLFAQARPTEFRRVQDDPHRRFKFNRPADAAPVIPVTLLSNIFRQFVEDCQNITPTPQDNKLVLELAEAMCEFYTFESERQSAFLRVLRNNSMDLTGAKIEGTDYSTDGNSDTPGMDEGALWVVKNDLGSRDTEPFCEALIHYYHATRETAGRVKNALLPCLIGVLIGPHFGFVGAVWDNTRPNCQVLTELMPLTFHMTHHTMQAKAARYFTAYRKAVQSIWEWHRLFVAVADPMSLPDLAFPDQTTYTCLQDGTTKTFRYIRQFNDEKLVFNAEGQDGVKLFVKFTSRYSKDAHIYANSIGFAPRLRACDILPGDWVLVVMDDLSVDYEELAKSQRVFSQADIQLLTDHLSSFHAGNFVHGNIISENILVQRQAQSSGPLFQLVDYDWAGLAGRPETVYPPNLNRDSVKRPEGAIDGQQITVAHDKEMILWVLDDLEKGAQPQVD